MKEVMGINLLGFRMFLESQNDNLLTVEFGDAWSWFDPFTGVAVPDAFLT